MKRILLVILLTVTSVSLSAKTVKIGVVTRSFKKGITNSSYTHLTELAIQQAIADNKEVLKKKEINIELVKYHYNEKSLSAFEAIQKAIAGDTIVGIGLDQSRFAQIAGPSLKKSNYQVLSPYATSTALNKFHPSLLLYSDDNKKRAELIDHFIVNEIKPKRMMAIVSWDRNYSVNLFRNLSEDLKSRTKLLKVLDKDIDKSKLLKEVMNYKPDVILLPNFPSNSAEVINIIHEKGLNPVYISGDSWGESANGRFLALTKKSNFKAFIIRQYSKIKMSTGQLNFMKSLLKSNVGRNNEFRITDMLFFDSMSIIVKTILRLKSYSRKDFNSEIAKMYHQEGLMREYCFEPSKCKRSKYKVLKIENNKFSFYKEIN